MGEIIKQLQEVTEGLELHVNKIGLYNNETIKQALREDVFQLKSAIAGLKTRL